MTFIVVPVVTLFIIKVPNGEHGPVLGSVLFFGSMSPLQHTVPLTRNRCGTIPSGSRHLRSRPSASFPVRD